ncbi:MAG: hypothetical protein QM765_21310 [Myxococcales bacterium]
MLFLRAAFLLGSLGICTLAPGLAVIRRLGWAPQERLVGSVGLSLIFVYLSALAVHVSGAPTWTCHGLTLASAGLLWLYRRDVLVLLRDSRCRRILLATVALFAWLVLMLLIIRHNTGGSWCCDWFEHYQRSLHFLDRGPKEQVFLNQYLLPARPPLMNLLAMYAMAIAGRDFAIYQVVCVFLAALLLMPLALIARLFARRGAPILLLAGLLALNPAFVENATFAWTKIPTAFFCVLAFHLYLAGWRRNDHTQIGAAFLSCTAAMLVHYSAGPYLLFMSCHYLVMVVLHRTWRQAALAALLSGLLLSTWLGYAVAVFGWKTTIASTSTVSDSAKLTLSDNLVKIGANILDTVVPAFVHYGPQLEGDLRMAVPGAIFHAFQNNIVIAMGSAGGLFALAFAASALLARGRGLPRRERVFWLLGLPITFVLGVASHGTRNNLGLGHICGQTLVYMGIALVAARLPRTPHALRVLGLHGLAFDAVIGIGTLLYLESNIEEWTHTWNWLYKRDNHIDYIGDLAATGAWAWRVLAFIGLIFWFWKILTGLGLLRRLGSSRATGPENRLAAS